MDKSFKELLEEAKQELDIKIQSLPPIPSFDAIYHLPADESDWEIRQDETNSQYEDRIKEFRKEYWKLVKGDYYPQARFASNLPIMVRPNRVVLSKDINIELIKETSITHNRFKKKVLRDKRGEPILDKNWNTIYYEEWECPFCHLHPYLMRILSWRYPEGFYDRGGILATCICIGLRKRDRSKLLWEHQKARGQTKDAEQTAKEIEEAMIGD